MTGISTTTPTALRAAFEPLILAISPSYAEYQGVTWNPVDGVDPAGSDLRSFRLLTEPRGIDPQGVYGGDGCESICDLRIRTAYGGLSDNEVGEIIQSDLHDLWGALHPTPGGSAGSVSGFISFGGGFIEIEPVDDDDYQETSDLVIDYVLEVHYKAAV
jgi:hypothetical protein